MEVVHEVALRNNEKIRESESRAAMYELELRFKPDARPRPPLVGAGQPLRQLLREGAAQKINQKGSSSREIVLLLLTDQLLYTAADADLGASFSCGTAPSSSPTAQRRSPRRRRACTARRPSRSRTRSSQWL